MGRVHTIFWSENLKGRDHSENLGIDGMFPRVGTGEKNSPTVAHVCRKRRLKWVLPQVGGWSTGLATLSLTDFNRYRNLNNCKVVEALCSSGDE
jgi:hypothetical protein